ncbi:hypothetical protein [Nocardia flavorosea]|uniref:hypothetical protein n=1 Tax=Nocardia flavorosea TaxID=53429 RepID=UPI001E370DE9|nr:hypothetical protein [Nocardia flavorosea]
MMVRVGAVHLGWDVVSVAAGGSGVPIRPVQVEGSYNPPAYLLADAAGKLYTSGAGRQRPDLGMAIPDVREILGHPQIVIAGATWPAELVFRARLYNPLASVGTYLRGKPDVIALPYPDDWPDPKIDAYVRLVEQLDVEVEPIPESIALSGYVRALGLVRAPDHRLPDGLGATAVHFDGQVVDGRANVLVVAVHGDEERPTESVYVPIDPESTRDPRVADDTVIEVMAAARAIGADNSTVLLAGQVVFNETLRFAFRNHLGQRLKKAEHPMHALVLGATHLLVSENEDDDEEEDPAGYPNPAPPAGPAGAAAPGPQHGASGRAEETAGSPARNPAAGPHQPVPPHPAARGSGPYPSPPARTPSSGPGAHPAPPGTGPAAAGSSWPGEPGSGTPTPGPDLRGGGAASAGGPAISPYAGSPQQYDAPGGPSGGDATVQVDRGELPPPITGPAGRFTRAPDPETGSQSAVPHPSGPGQPGRSCAGDTEAEDEQGKGKLWNKMKGNLFGANAVLGVAALAAASAGAAGGTGTAHAQVAPPGIVGTGYSVDTEHRAAGCVPMPRVLVEPPGEAGAAPPERPHYARVPAPEAGESAAGRGASEDDGVECDRSGIDTLRYLVPGRPGVTDPGPPFDI